VPVQKQMTQLPIGRGEIRREGREVAILAFGAMVTPSLAAGSELDATVANMRFVKPLDEALILELAGRHALLVTVEENTVQGGAGSAVAELLEAKGVAVPLLIVGLPDVFLEQGDPAILLKECGLTKDGIVERIRARLGERPVR
jgi:1-deoxy-D-xylulose-5-phosphate synthase